jgi:predicted amidophosphoribosyltransferase
LRNSTTKTETHPEDPRLRPVEEVIAEVYGAIATELCARCRRPLPTENDICPDCRDDLIEKANSYGGTPAEINLRYLGYVNQVRKGVLTLGS